MGRKTPKTKLEWLENKLDSTHIYSWYYGKRFVRVDKLKELIKEAKEKVSLP